MLSFAAITAHAPILLHANPASPRQYNADTFGALSQLIQKHGIEHIVSISSHPAYLRRGFSVYVEQEYELSFPDFGDLITKESIPLSWRLYHYIREQRLPIELLNTSKLDYGHAVPLYLLKQELEKHTLQALCVNDDPAATPEQRYAFGQQLGALLRSFDAPVLVLCTGDLCLPDTKTEASICQTFNKQYIEFILKSLQQPFAAASTQPAGLIAPCLQGPLDITRGVVSESSCTSEVLSTAQSAPVTLFSALITC